MGSRAKEQGFERIKALGNDGHRLGRGRIGPSQGMDRGQNLDIQLVNSRGKRVAKSGGMEGVRGK